MSILRKRLLGCMAAVLLITCWNLPVSALPIVSPVGVSAPDSLPFFGSNLFQTIDQSGLATGFDSGVTDFDTYIGSDPTHEALNPSNSWTGILNPFIQFPGNIDYNLVEVLSISRFALWGANNAASIFEFTLLGSRDGSFTGEEVLLGDFNGSFSFTAPIAYQLFDLEAADAQFIRLQIKSNWGAPFIGFGEVAFEGTTASVPVPEPATILLLGTGLAGLIGFGRRKIPAC